MLIFLRETIPQEAKTVRANLQNFNACQNAIRKELDIAMDIQSGKVVKMQAAAVRTAQDVWDHQDAKLQLFRARRS
jgi:hypothetical protein